MYGYGGIPPKTASLANIYQFLALAPSRGRRYVVAPAVIGTILAAQTATIDNIIYWDLGATVTIGQIYSTKKHILINVTSSRAILCPTLIRNHHTSQSL